MKNKLIATIAVIALFIPTFLAVGSYFWSEKSPAETGKVTELTIADLNGKEYKVSDTDIIDEFLSLNESADAIDSLPDPLLSADYFMITYTSKA